MENREFRLHAGARMALNVAGVLCIILLMAAPIGIWILIRVAGGKLSITSEGVTARALGSVHFDFKEVERIGICMVPIVARGIGGALARRKVGGNQSTNLYVLTRNNKKRMIIVSMYEDHQAIMDQISATVGKPYEKLSVGLFGVKWPEANAA